MYFSERRYKFSNWKHKFGSLTIRSVSVHIPESKTVSKISLRIHKKEMPFKFEQRNNKITIEFDMLTLKEGDTIDLEFKY